VRTNLGAITAPFFIGAVMETLKNLIWIAMVIFAICGFVQTLLTLNPRVTALEGRVATNESKISAIEVKLDELIYQGHETSRDVKSIHRMMLEIHK
jgi:low affinity Fe/Cu permease